MNPDWLKLAVYACPIAVACLLGAAAYVFRDLRRAQDASSDWPSALQGDLPSVPDQVSHSGTNSMGCRHDHGC